MTLASSTYAIDSAAGSDKVAPCFRHSALLGLLVGALTIAGCEDTATGPLGAMVDEEDPEPGELVFRSQVQPVTRAEDALPTIFIPPFQDCRDPLPGDTGEGPGGKVCTHTVLSGCTEPGKYFGDYASCDVVRTQRPFWEDPPAKEPSPNDPRLKDPEFMRELAWMTEQVEACACVCCHDSRNFDGKFGKWDIARGEIWLDTLSDNGLALFSGLADSTTLGAYPASENNGFDRTSTGLPTTDTERMKKFTLAELERRGVSREEAKAVTPFGGPLYTQRITPPAKCKPGETVTSDGKVRWLSGKARYVYVLEAGSDNPGVPPNLDLPEGTIWRLDVLASKQPLASGMRYGTTPAGSFQTYPESTSAPALVKGKTYQLHVLKDVAVPLANCLFVYGEENVDPEPSEGDTGDGDGDGDGDSKPEADAGVSSCKLSGSDADGFGATCSKSDDCSCKADYCSLMPGSTEGYCTVTGCKDDASICPTDWSCLDLSIFSPGLPAICSKP
jgi:hypothetical protein